VRKIECDRCGVTSGNIDPMRIPSGWSDLSGYHLCMLCDDLFREFLRGEATPAIARVQLAQARGYLGPDRRIAPPREVANDRRRKTA
jgi:hypothetical protein